MSDNLLKQAAVEFRNQEQYDLAERLENASRHLAEQRDESRERYAESVTSHEEGVDVEAAERYYAFCEAIEILSRGGSLDDNDSDRTPGGS